MQGGNVIVTGVGSRPHGQDRIKQLQKQNKQLRRALYKVKQQLVSLRKSLQPAISSVLIPEVRQKDQVTFAMRRRA